MVLTGVSACLVALGTPAAQAERIREIISYDDVRIEVIAEGRGPTVVLLPSRGRDSRILTILLLLLPAPVSTCCGRSRAVLAVQAR